MPKSPPKPKSPPPVPAPASARGPAGLVWAGFALGGLAFAGGLALLLSGRAPAGVALAVAGILAVSLAYLLPALPWDSLRRALEAATPGPGAPVAAPGAPVRPAAEARLRLLGLAGVARAYADTLMGPGDVLSLNRLFLLAPILLLLALSAVLATASTVEGTLAFVAAGIILWVYFEDMTRPLVLPKLRQNLRALLAQVPALPFQAYGAYLLNSRYDDPRMVWAGFFVCAAACGWGYYALGRWPFDLLGEGAAPARLGWSLSKPFFTPRRVAVMSSFAAAAALAGCLAEFVLPADHPMAAIMAAFAAMLLLLLSFPWIPAGAAFIEGLPPSLAATLALAAALLAFGLGAHGQDLIERNTVDAGLWYFLAGGVVLVLGLSRFAAEPARDAESDGPFWSRLEVVAVSLLVAGAFVAHAWHVGTFPYAVEGDEGGGGVWATWVLKGTVENHFINQNYPLAFFSVTALFFRLFGIGVSTLRWHSVYFGTLSVFTAYCFMRSNMGRGAAFLATLLMTFSYWHLHYSRFGHYNIEQVALQMAAFYFVFKALRTGRLWQWAAGGFAFGLAMFPHMAGRLLPFQGIAFLVYLFVFRRDLLRRHLPGFLAFILLTWAIASPALVYWNRSRGNSLGRIQEVSIFNKNNTNAPLDTLGGFVSNCRVSMLMFNYQGDTRPRDNPVAPDKILEHWTAVLFGLAFLYVLYHWREPVNFFLLAVFFVNLCASVFSVEAPQTLRTAGNIPIVFCLMAVPLADLGSALRRRGAWLSRLAFAGLLAAFAFFSWRSARRLFVDERGLSFDVEPTYIARTAGLEGGPDTQAVFWGTGFASSHPPMQLLTLDTPLRNFYGPFEYLPVTRDTGQDQLLFFGDAYEQMLPYLKSVYPWVPVRTIPDQRGGDPIALYLRLDKADLRRSEGLDGSAWLKGRAVPVAGMDPAWPAAGVDPGARRVRVSGSLNIDAYGTYALSMTGRSDVRVLLDGRPAFSREGGSEHSRPALMAKGLHALEVDLEPRGDDPMRLMLKGVRPGPQGSPWSLGVLGSAPVGRNEVLRVAPSGFLARYYLSRLPQGPPVFEAVEPVVVDHWLDPPFLGNWCVLWRTRFYVGVPGPYRFTMNGGELARVTVDGVEVWRTGAPEAAGRPPKWPVPFVTLSKGWHEYEALFGTSGDPRCDLDWVTPDGKVGLFWTPGMRPQ